MLLERQPWTADAQSLFVANEIGKINAWITATTLTPESASGRKLLCPALRPVSHSFRLHLSTRWSCRPLLRSRDPTSKMTCRSSAHSRSEPKPLSLGMPVTSGTLQSQCFRLRNSSSDCSPDSPCSQQMVGAAPVGEPRAWPPQRQPGTSRSIPSLCPLQSRRKPSSIEVVLEVRSTR